MNILFDADFLSIVDLKFKRIFRTLNAIENLQILRYYFLKRTLNYDVKNFFEINSNWG